MPVSWIWPTSPLSCLSIITACVHRLNESEAAQVAASGSSLLKISLCCMDINVYAVYLHKHKRCPARKVQLVSHCRGLYLIHSIHITTTSTDGFTLLITAFGIKMWGVFDFFEISQGLVLLLMLLNILCHSVRTEGRMFVYSPHNDS